MTIDECEKIFDQALSSTTEGAFCHAIEPLFKEYKILSIRLARGSIYWRARLIEENKKEYSNIVELDYVPSGSVSRGRLNDEGESCFYISTHQHTTLVEKDVTEGQLVQIAGFRVINESPLLVIIGEYANVQKYGYMRLTGSDPDGTIANLMNEKPLEEALTEIYIDKFFIDILGDSNARKIDYLFTRALSKAIYSKHTYGGIIYPSAKDPDGFNIGVKIKPSDESFHNVCCSVVKITKKRRFGVIDYTTIKAAKTLDDDGNFIWCDGGGPDKFRLYNMSKEEYDVASINPNDKNNLIKVLRCGRKHANK